MLYENNKLYLISLDVLEAQRYENITGLIKTYSHVNCFSKTWMICSNKTANDIYNHLQPLLSTKDHLIIIEVKNNKQGLLVKSAWDWINSNII